MTRLKKRNTYEISEKDEKEWYSGLIAIALVWFAFINCKPWPLLYKLLKFWLVSFSSLFYLPFVLFFLFAHSLPANLTGCKRFDKKKYSNLTVYRDSEFFRSF